MSRIQSMILVLLDEKADLIEPKNDSMIFVSVCSDKLFEEYMSDKSVDAGFIPSDSHGTSIARVLRKAYQMKVQYVKVMGPGGQLVFVNRDSPIVRLLDGSWSVSMNGIRSEVRKRMRNKNQSSVEEHLIFFDDNYSPIGHIHDLKHLLGANVKDLPEMSIEDLSVYIARWGGVPGQEKHLIPYNL